MGRFIRRSSSLASSLGRLDSGAGRVAPSHRHRVAMRMKGADPQIVWVAKDREYVRAIAAQINAVAGEERAWVESWDASVGGGRWVRACAAPAGAGAVASRVVVRDSSAPAKRERALPRAPRSGELVQAVLLAERTRRGGWRARLLDYALEGPITNEAAAPALATAHQQVTLRVAAANGDGTHLQMEWT